MSVIRCQHCSARLIMQRDEWTHAGSGQRHCMGMASLAKPEEKAIARVTDPLTSHEAAASVTDLTGKQKAVLRVLVANGPMTDEEIRAEYESKFRAGMTDLYPMQSESGLRTRRAELVKKGAVRDSGASKVKSTGRKATVWAATGSDS